jgi:hypothetical protein
MAAGITDNVWSLHKLIPDKSVNNETKKDWEARFKEPPSDNWQWLLVAAILSIGMAPALGSFFIPLLRIALQAVTKLRPYYRRTGFRDLLMYTC